MHIMVLGAGVIGVTTAYYLAKAGYQVTVIDRQQGPALETSFVMLDKLHQAILHLGQHLGFH